MIAAGLSEIKASKSFKWKSKIERQRTTIKSRRQGLNTVDFLQGLIALRLIFLVIAKNKMNNSSKESLVFTPENEPYLGRQSVFHFDQVIISCLEANAEIAAYTHKNELNDLQKAACQIIPQGINLALSIREMVRQGYLFAAAVLMRPLIERAAIISYLHKD